MAEQQRHVSCVGAGRNWTHAVRVVRVNISSFINIICFVVGNNITQNKLATEFGQGAVGVAGVGNQNLNDGNTSEFNESISTSVSETVISWMNES